MEEEEALFTPKAALARTPPSGLAPPHGGQPGPGSEPGPSRMDRPTPPRPPPWSVASTPGTSAQPAEATPRHTGGKHQLTSPEDRQPVEVIRMCRKASEMQPSQSAPVTRPTTPVTMEVEEEVGANDIAVATKAELLSTAHRELALVAKVVTDNKSKLNKEAANTIQASCQNVFAVISALTLRISEAEIKLGEANLRSSKLEQEILLAKTETKVVYEHIPSSPAVPSYATALKLSKDRAPRKIPAAQGPVLAIYPAPEHVAAFKSAEETKAELKRTIKPQEINVQIEKVRKVGNAGVVVQTTSEASAAKIREAMPATLRVTEPKRRAPLVCLRHVEGDGDLEEVYFALHDQNFRDSEEWTLERLKAQSKLAFKKRGRGTTTVVLECAPKLREALLARERVYIGWQVIEVMDFLSVTCCRKCHLYGHPEKYCRSAEEFCGRCGASGHRRDNCTAENECCATCKRFNRPDATMHPTGSATCPARQHAEQRSMESVDYR